MSQLIEKAENQNMWLYDKVDIVNDFTFDGNIVVSLDTAIHLDKVSSSLFKLGKKGIKEVYEILDSIAIDKRKSQPYTQKRQAITATPSLLKLKNSSKLFLKSSLAN